MIWNAQFHIYPDRVIQVNNIKLNSRPSLELEEAEKEDGTFEISSQAWNPMEFSFSYMDGRTFYEWFMDNLVSSEIPNAKMTITLNDDDGQQIEQWELQNVKCETADLNIMDNTVNATVLYSEVGYTLGIPSMLPTSNGSYWSLTTQLEQSVRNKYKEIHQNEVKP